MKTSPGITSFDKEIKEVVNFRGAVQLGKCLYMDVNTSSQNDDFWLYFMCDVITTTNIIWPSQILL